MTNVTTVAGSRRQFLKFLAGSPLIAMADQSESFGDGNGTSWIARLTGSADADRGPQGDGVISSPDQALNVFDFEAAARTVMNPAHFGYIQTGSDDDATVVANREGFTRFVIHPRRLVDVSKVDPSIQLLGMRLGSPIFLAP